MNPTRRAAALNRLSDENVLSPDARNAFEQQLEQIRIQGYATSNSEVDAGIWGNSAPMYQRTDSHAAAVITLMAPNTRVNHRQPLFIVMPVRLPSHQIGRASCRESVWQ